MEIASSLIALTLTEPKHNTHIATANHLNLIKKSIKERKAHYIRMVEVKESKPKKVSCFQALILTLLA